MNSQMNFPMPIKGLQTPSRAGVKSLDRFKSGYSTISNKEYSRNKLPSLRSPEASMKKDFLLSLSGKKRGIRYSTENPFSSLGSINSHNFILPSKTPPPINLPPKFKENLSANISTPKFQDGFNATFSKNGGII
jgi:hypothetical protein